MSPRLIMVAIAMATITAAVMVGAQYLITMTYPVGI